MQFLDALATLLDLPQPFLRPQNQWFAQLMDSFAMQISLETSGNDGIGTQVLTFPAAMDVNTRQVTLTGSGAQDGWIDIIGLLVNLPRNQGEGNNPYAIRIVQTLLAWVGTVPAVEAWINIFAPGGSVSENSSGLGYTIALPSSMSPSQVAAFLASFNWIRPDGVPFVVTQGTGALYVGTVEFLGGGMVMGSYLSSGSAGALALGAVTLSTQPLIPTLMFTDPILNPSLAPTLGLP